MIWGLLGAALRLPFILTALVFVPKRWRTGPVWCALMLHDMERVGVWTDRCRVCGLEDHL